MGFRLGMSAKTRLTLWAYLNYWFSPQQINETAAKFETFLSKERKNMNVEDAIRLGIFYEFAAYLGCIVEKNKGDSRYGWNYFEPGTIDILSLVVFRNLCGIYPSKLDKMNPSHPKQNTVVYVNGKKRSKRKNDKGLKSLYPRPMVFERTFGDSEEIIIRSTKYGIKVVLQSQFEDVVNKRTETRFKFGTEVGFSG